MFVVLNFYLFSVSHFHVSTAFPTFQLPFQLFNFSFQTVQLLQLFNGLTLHISYNVQFQFSTTKNSQPDINRLISTAQLQNIGANKERCLECQKVMATIRNACEGYMKEKVGGPLALTALRKWENSLVRLLGGFSQEKTWTPGVVGKYEPEKKDTLLSNWLLYVTKEMPALKEMIVDCNLAKYVDVDSDDDGAELEATPPLDFKRRPDCEATM